MKLRHTTIHYYKSYRKVAKSSFPECAPFHNSPWLHMRRHPKAINFAASVKSLLEGASVSSIFRTQPQKAASSINAMSAWQHHEFSSENWD
jgi:hypothetical protein